MSKINRQMRSHIRMRLFTTENGANRTGKEINGREGEREWKKREQER